MDYKTAHGIGHDKSDPGRHKIVLQYFEKLNRKRIPAKERHGNIPAIQYHRMQAERKKEKGEADKRTYPMEHTFYKKLEFSKKRH
ncbi:MAG: hypothetical protein Q7R79_02385 [bacterium]|nr:hypothetical protein [bacterium]